MHTAHTILIDPLILFPGSTTSDRKENKIHYLHPIHLFFSFSFLLDTSDIERMGESYLKTLVVRVNFLTWITSLSLCNLRKIVKKNESTFLDMSILILIYLAQLGFLILNAQVDQWIELWARLIYWRLDISTALVNCEAQPLWIVMNETDRVWLLAYAFTWLYPYR